MNATFQAPRLEICCLTKFGEVVCEGHRRPIWDIKTLVYILTPNLFTKIVCQYNGTSNFSLTNLIITYLNRSYSFYYKNVLNNASKLKQNKTVNKALKVIKDKKQNKQTNTVKEIHALHNKQRSVHGVKLKLYFGSFLTKTDRHVRWRHRLGFQPALQEQKPLTLLQANSWQ